MYSSFLKSFIDKILVALGIILISPILILVAILVRTNLGSPILFSQQRPGHQGQPFKMYKFRTMTDQRDAQGELLPDANRLTPFGKLLRSTSLDELPELLNVLKGDMSLIGPRPLHLHPSPSP
jgi:undecaprenyl phosphate N,N'-diacetylbacillosamine 1-phosphate transferase